MFSMRGWFDRRGIRILRFNFETEGEEQKAEWFGEPRFLVNDETFGIVFKEGERLIGLTGQVETRRGRIVSLELHTNLRVLGPFGPGPGRRDRIEPFSTFLPAGVPANGFSARRDDAGLLTALGLAGDLDPRRATIVVTREDGAATRFHQIERNRYRADFASTAISPRARPELEVLAPDLIRIDGIDHDLVPVHAHEPPKGEQSSFDNVFVAQAKAVNLQSNYKAYDITRMDPLHLTDSGTGKRVFALPDPASNDYYDANRIFVPKGLLYVPEFTGEQHAQTHVVTSMADYTKATSFNVGVKGAAGPAKFGGSYSHKRASEKIRGRNSSLTLGMSKALFYDLVLDKARMALDPEFRARVLRLAEIDTQEAYDAFVDVFGTHYPQAVVYGGMGILEMEYTGNTIGRLVSGEVDITVSAQAEVKGKGKAGFNIGSGRSSSEKFQREMRDEIENFYWVGGAHAGLNKESWGVGIDGVVPVHVSLRPLEELLLPPYFSDPVINFEVRNKLRQAIDRHVDEAEARLAQDVDTMPRLFEVELVKVSAAARSQEADGTWDIAGRIFSGANAPPGPAPVIVGADGTSRRARLPQVDGDRVFFDVAVAGPDQPVPAETDTVTIDTTPPMAYYFKSTDAGEAGDLRQVFAVDPCVVELGGSLGLFGDWTEYDTPGVGDWNEHFHGSVSLPWSEIPENGTKTVRLELDERLLRDRAAICTVSAENAEGFARCQTMNALAFKPIGAGCSLIINDERRALCHRVRVCAENPDSGEPLCRELRRQCKAAASAEPSGICERATVEFQVREIRTGFARPATRPVCPGTTTAGRT